MVRRALRKRQTPTIYYSMVAAKMRDGVSIQIETEVFINMADGRLKQLVEFNVLFEALEDRDLAVHDLLAMPRE